MGFLNTNNILYRHQYGFRPNHSTIHPIIHLLNHCAEAASKSSSEYTIASLFDLPKAFDVINHDILLNKLHRYGIRETVKDTLFFIANEQLKKKNLFTWFYANKLCVNESKTKYIFIRPSHMKPDLTTLNISINGTQLNRIGNDRNEKSSKVLGVDIDEHLT